MYAAPAGLDPDLLDRLLAVAQQTAIALIAGIGTVRLLGVGLRARGLPFLSGLVGLYAGSWLWGFADWHAGPMIAGHGVFPAVAGALAVAGTLRLIELGFASSR